MTTDFLHGPEVIDVDSSPRPIRVVRSSVIHLFGTALKGPVNKPVLIAGSPLKGEMTFGHVRMGGTIPKALDGIFDVHGAVVIVTNVLDPAVHNTAVAASDRVLDAKRRIILPHYMAFNVVVKAAGGSGSAYVAGTDYTFDPEQRTIQVLAAGAITAEAGASLSVAYSYPDPTKVDEDDIIGGVFDGEYEGVHTALSAENVVGFPGKIFCAPWFTQTHDFSDPDDPTFNPVVAELLGIADRMRAVIIKDGNPDGPWEDWVMDRTGWGSKRVYLVANSGVDIRRGNDGNDADYESEPVSPRVCGLISKIDSERGFWWSPSNQQIGQGVSGLTKPVEFRLGDKNSEANLLNELNMAVIVRHQGFRLWGNHTTSDDEKWRFLSVVRTNDIIAESLLRAHLWAIDRCMDRRFFEIVPESVNGFLDELTTLGAILGGECWVVPELNTEQSLMKGHSWFDYEFTPPYPAERITFRSHMTGRFIANLFQINNRIVAPRASDINSGTIAA